MCGIFGVVGCDQAPQVTAAGLHALQHRGQEGSGIVSTDGELHYSIRKQGLVRDAFHDHAMQSLLGNSAIGHNRYSTTGQSIVANLQPLSVKSSIGWLALAHNGNLVNAGELTASLEKAGSIFQSTTDTEVIIHLMARSGKTLPEALIDALKQVKGAYSLLVLNQEVMIGVRDPHGFRPLVLGDFQGCPVFSSETTAFDLIGARYIREVMPGEMLMISLKDKSMRSIRPFEQTKPARCIFEYVYFSRPDSVVYSSQVHDVRKALGKRLAKEQFIDADVVIPVPDSGVPAALGYAEESGIPFEVGIIRSHYVGRTFIQPNQKIRDLKVRMKLNPVQSTIRNKRVIVIDDSIVRGTTSKKIVRMLRDNGAVEVHLRISAPPTTDPCYYGIDTPHKDELIAASNSMDEIARYIGVDSIGYLSKEGLLEVGEKFAGEGFCTACFTGEYPVQQLGVTKIRKA